MTGAISSDITALKNNTAYTNGATTNSSTTKATANGIESDYTMFLQLMLAQLENQDPTEPMENTEWLSQLAQYSSLEQMTAMNENMESIASSIDSMHSSVGTNAVISQTLSLVGKDVTVQTEDGKEINGSVQEAKFDGGNGYIKVGDKYYSIGSITSIREPELQADASADII